MTADTFVREVQIDELAYSAGATPLIALAPAIANAIFATTGQRLYSMPPM